MLICFFIVLIILYLSYPHVAFIIRHPLLCIKWAFTDVYNYFKFKQYNNCPFYGVILAFTAFNNMAFGCGKTLSAVKTCNDISKRYNNKPVWDAERKDWDVQHVFFCSNVELKGVDNYIPFTSKSQFVEIDKFNLSKNDILIFVLDECGIVFNSREFKTNISADFLTNLLQVRHNKVGFILTAQRFSMIDKVLRECTSKVVACEKWFRIFILRTYNAYDLENADNPSLVKALSTECYLATNKLFGSYNTNFNIGKLKERLENHDFMDTKEILASRGDDGNILRVNKYNRKFKKRFQK